MSDNESDKERNTLDYRMRQAIAALNLIRQQNRERRAREAWVRDKDAFGGCCGMSPRVFLFSRFSFAQPAFPACLWISLSACSSMSRFTTHGSVLFFNLSRAH